jgi:hypothetical protein
MIHFLVEVVRGPLVGDGAHPMWPQSHVGLGCSLEGFQERGHSHPCPQELLHSELCLAGYQSPPPLTAERAYLKGLSKGLGMLLCLLHQL